MLGHGCRVPSVPVSMELSRVGGSRQTGRKMQWMVQGNVGGVGMVGDMGVVVEEARGLVAALKDWLGAMVAFGLAGWWGSWVVAGLVGWVVEEGLGWMGVVVEGARGLAAALEDWLNALGPWVVAGVVGRVVEEGLGWMGVF